MKRDIAKKMLVVLTGIALAQLTKAETDLGFRLTSPTLTEGKPMLAQQVLDSFGCTGRNQSPALRWMRAPSGTKSFAITVYDPDDRFRDASAYPRESGSDGNLWKVI